MTPYDAALRIAERNLDAVRRAIGGAVADLERIEHAHIAIEAKLVREGMLAAQDHRLATAHFFIRAREQRGRLAADRAAARVQLEALRRKAVECYGSHMVIEGAVDTFRLAADRAADAAEQAALDDRAGTAFAAAARTRTQVQTQRAGMRRPAGATATAP